MLKPEAQKKMAWNMLGTLCQLCRSTVVLCCLNTVKRKTNFLNWCIATKKSTQTQTREIHPIVGTSSPSFPCRVAPLGFSAVKAGRQRWEASSERLRRAKHVCYTFILLYIISKKKPPCRSPQLIYACLQLQSSLKGTS